MRALWSLLAAVLSLFGYSPKPGIVNGFSTTTAAWSCVRWHESRGIYTEPGGGAYQFEGSTWEATGHWGRPETASVGLQDAAALYLWWNDLVVFGEPWTAWRPDERVCGLGG